MKLDDLNICVTGKGFIGSYLKIFLNINKAQKIIFLSRKDFQNKSLLKKKIKDVDIIFHNASSVKKTKTVIKENIRLTETLISSINESKLKVFVQFGTTHEKLNNFYGISKKDSYKKIKYFCKNKKITLFKYTIPNVYGCFYKPYHNSFISTLIYEFIKNDNVDSIKNLELNKCLELTFVNDLICKIINDLKSFNFNNQKNLLFEKKVTGKVISIGSFLNKVKLLNNQINSNIYKYTSILEKNIINIILSYHFILKKNIKVPAIKFDDRGFLYEANKSIGCNHSFLSSSYKNAIRGNHFHTNKFEIFHIINGEAIIILKNLFNNSSRKYILNDNNKSFLVIPPFVNHTFISNKNNTIGLFFSSEIFDTLKPDTYKYEL